jgi:hypothetical protein
VRRTETQAGQERDQRDREPAGRAEIRAIVTVMMLATAGPQIRPNAR